MRVWHCSLFYWTCWMLTSIIVDHMIWYCTWSTNPPANAMPLNLFILNPTPQCQVYLVETTPLPVSIVGLSTPHPLFYPSSFWNERGYCVCVCGCRNVVNFEQIDITKYMLLDCLTATQAVSMRAVAMAKAAADHDPNHDHVVFLFAASGFNIIRHSMYIDKMMNHEPWGTSLIYLHHPLV